MTMHHCRFCSAPLHHTFCDLGTSPLSNAFIKADQIDEPEVFYPLHVMVCERCWLVQLPEHQAPDRIFSNDYAYFSSYSESWLAHAREYVETMVARFGYDAGSQVVEVASNDGYLLQYFQSRGVPVLGIEPATNCAEVAQQNGIPTQVCFFGVEAAKRLASEGFGADLLLGNNVLAHVPDINDFVAGLAILLKSDGVITMEFPHLLELMGHNQFDTIYHEHYSYLSLLTVEQIFLHHGLTLFDVQQLTTHGGSLRIFARHAADLSKPVSAALGVLREREREAGLNSVEPYAEFTERVAETRLGLLEFLIAAKHAGKKVWGYGAPAKGNTLLNYCGIRSDLLEATVERSPHKQGHYLPGTRIPVHAPEQIEVKKPDYLLILPWNLKEEIMEQMAHISAWGGRFVLPIPQVQVLG